MEELLLHEIAEQFLVLSNEVLIAAENLRKEGYRLCLPTGKCEGTNATVLQIGTCNRYLGRNYPDSKRRAPVELNMSGAFNWRLIQGGVQIQFPSEIGYLNLHLPNSSLLTRIEKTIFYYDAAGNIIEMSGGVNLEMTGNYVWLRSEAERFDWPIYNTAPTLTPLTGPFKIKVLEQAFFLKDEHGNMFTRAFPLHAA